MEKRIEVSKNLREARLRKKIHQKRLGEMLGYSGMVAQRMIHAFEYAERPIPLRKIRQLAEILDIPIDKLVP